MLSRARIDAARRASTCPASDNGSSVNRIGPVFPGVSARSRDYGDVAAARTAAAWPLRGRIQDRAHLAGSTDPLPIWRTFARRAVLKLPL